MYIYILPIKNQVVRIILLGGKDSNFQPGKLSFQPMPVERFESCHPKPFAEMPPKNQTSIISLKLFGNVTIDALY